MPKTVSLYNMSAKYLSDFISHPDWMEKGYEDIFLSGTILAEVLPRFEAPPDAAPKAGENSAAAAGEGATAATPTSVPPAPLYVPVLEAPVAPVLTEKGDPDWAKLSREEVADLRAKIAEHNKKFLVWCRTPLARPLSFTDRQYETVQRVLKFYSPRSEADKHKDAEKQKRARPELPANEFTLQLLREFSLSIGL